MFRTSIAVMCLATPALADRFEAQATCTAMEEPLHYSCDITLTQDGAPVEGAAFTVTPAMPSMPMAHNIAPEPAVETDTPGTYATDLHLEMPGDWTLTLDVTAPRRDRVVLPHTFQEDASGQGHMGHSGHGHSD